MLNYIGLVAFVVVALLLIWSVVRAWRIRNIVLRCGVVVIAAVLAVAVSAVSALIVAGMVKAHSRSAALPDLKVEATPERIARGKAISDGFCSACHSKTGTLTGGLELADDIPIPIGSFVSANLTPAGDLKDWSDGAIFRAIRNGIDADGHWLTFMTYTNASKLSDDDTKSVIAYIRGLPAAGAPTPKPPGHLNLLGLGMLGAGMLPSGKPVIAGSVNAPPLGPTREFGEYILSYQDCRECHGANLTGGVPGQLAPLGPDLNLVKGWTRDQFIATMRTGIDPDGHTIAKEMPWRPIGRMSDDELTAIHEYLTHLPTADDSKH